jgi:hypothetical protein
LGCSSRPCTRQSSAAPGPRWRSRSGRMVSKRLPSSAGTRCTLNCWNGTLRCDGLLRHGGGAEPRLWHSARPRGVRQPGRELSVGFWGSHPRVRRCGALRGAAALVCGAGRCLGRSGRGCGPVHHHAPPRAQHAPLGGSCALLAPHERQLGLPDRLLRCIADDSYHNIIHNI